MQKFRAIHQFLPTLGYGDAIGNQALYLQSLLRQQGIAAEVFAGGWDARLESACQHFSAYKGYSHVDNLLLLHYSIGGAINEFAATLPDRKVMIYHNITPGHYFWGVNDQIARLCDEARAMLPSLAGTMPAIADSPYNTLELKALGFETLGVIPPVPDLNRLNTLLTSADANRVRHLFGKRDTRDWLFVGRQVPNKSIENVLRAFYYYHTWIEPNSRLLLVGNGAGMEPYVDMLYALVTQLNLDGAVVFAGYQTDGGLAAFYEMADLYVSMSEHEGFCVPLVEAMYSNIPIMAYSSTNVPYTLGDAGVLIHHKNYPAIAEMAHELITNAELRAKIIARQRQRLPDFSEAHIQRTFLNILQQLPPR